MGIWATPSFFMMVPLHEFGFCIQVRSGAEREEHLSQLNLSACPPKRGNLWEHPQGTESSMIGDPNEQMINVNQS